MSGPGKPRRSLATACCLLGAGVAVRAQQLPDHPVVTEVFNNPRGAADASLGRDPNNPHQEFIELWLPPQSALNPNLDPDALNLTFYEVEGDATSTGLGLINYRFDLPTFCVRANPAFCPPETIHRPPSGVIVLGWVDYDTALNQGTCAGNGAPCHAYAENCADGSDCIADPPTDLAGTPDTRIALINGGITDTGGDFLFIAVNGHHFSGTNNFPTLQAENRIDLPAEASSGVIQNGSQVYLLVDRDAPDYVELCDDQHAAECAAGADPVLPDNDAGLSSNAMLDGYAANDHALFDVLLQPYDAPTGFDIDLETVLDRLTDTGVAGAFSFLIPQIPEEINIPPEPGLAGGYARIYLDVPKTTETSAVDDPVADAVNAYRHVRNDGPFFPTPGRVVSTSSPPELGVAAAPEQILEILTRTIGRPGILAANVGGDFPIDLSATVDTSSDPAVATFAPGPPDIGVVGQSFAFPALFVTPGPNAVHGATASATVTITAADTNAADPAVLNPAQTAAITATILNPTTGRDADGLPFEATVFAAIQSIPGTAASNELLDTSFGQFLLQNFGNLAQDSLCHGEALINPATDISNGTCLHNGCSGVCDPGCSFGCQPQFVIPFPDLVQNFLNLPGPDGIPGTSDDLVNLVADSAEQQVHATYTGNFQPQTGVRAIAVNSPPTLTSGGAFAPAEYVRFADSRGRTDNLRSGLTNALTTRTFEMAIVDSNVRLNGSIETGASDDFALVVEVVETAPGAPVTPGTLLFLSYTGGLQGADIDSLELPPGNNVANLIFLDLDNLNDVLGVLSVKLAVVVDAAGNNGQIDVMEVFSLNPVGAAGCADADADCDGDVDLQDYAGFLDCVTEPGVPAINCVTFDLDDDGDVDFADFRILMIVFTGAG